MAVPTDAVAFGLAAAAALGFALAGRLAAAATASRDAAVAGERVAKLQEKAKVEQQLFVPGVPESALTLFRVPHVRDQWKDPPTFPSPLIARAWPRNQNFVECVPRRACIAPPASRRAGITPLAAARARARTTAGRTTSQ